MLPTESTRNGGDRLRPRTPGSALLCLLAGLWLGAVGASAQPPSADWRTLEIPGFRFHMPAESEPWTRHVASRMEEIRRRVEAEVGFYPADVVDVLVMDPVGRANGVAWPILGRPRMVLYTTPPPADSVLGFYRDWSEILALHETVHLAHLLRPSRNPRDEILERLVPVGPLVRKAPNWVMEGYATQLEGRLTGWGRPHGDYRAALLRRWAQAGRLPSYGALSGDSRRWLGRAFPYLVGSAFLEWLEERAGDDASRKLWARLSARQNRSFDEAFRGVYGDSPSTLYHRFTAELTYRAMEIEARRSDAVEQGELWLDLSWQTGPPAVSPDGERLAAVVRSRTRPSRLVIWSTADDEEAATARQEALRRIQEEDPEDVPAVPPAAPPRKVLFELPSHHGAAPYEPRFAADGESVLFVRYGTGSESATFPGARIPDLYRWWPESGRVERVTRDAGVRRVDPAPDGTWAVGVRHPHGLSELVRIDLETGDVESLFEQHPSVDRVLDAPRLSADGERLVYLARRPEGGSIVVRHLASGTERRLPTAPRATLMHPAWAADGTILATVGDDGFLDVFAFDTALGGRRRLTRAPGGALAPAPSPNGDVFFLALEEDGFDLRRLPAATRPPAAWQPDRAELVRWAPAVRPPAREELPDLRPQAVDTPAEPYGAGPREHFPLVGGGWTVDGGRFEFGLRQGDPVGRLDLWLLGAVADPGAGTEGAGFAGRWKGGPWELGLRLFSTREEGAPGRDLDVESHRGAELSVGKTRLGDRISWRLEAGAAWDWAKVDRAKVDRAKVDRAEVDREILWLRGAVRRHHSWGAWRMSERLGAGFELGDTDGHGWRRARYDGEVRIGRRPVDGTRWELGGSLRRARSHDLRYDLDRYRIGGLAGSLLPWSVRARRPVPALPGRAAIGDELETRRIELEIGRLPWTLFGERHRLWSSPGDEIRLRVAGIEWTLTEEPLPLLRLPGVEITLGVAHLLDEPFEDRTEGWVGVRWRP